MKPIPKRPLIPILTDLLEYRKIGGNTIKYTEKVVKRYGDVCECSFTGIRSFFIHDPDVIREILTTQGLKMKRTYFFKAFRKVLGNGLFTSDGAYHKRQRQLIKPAFYPQRIQEYGRIMSGCADEEIKTWKPGSTININQAMTRITLKVITRALFGAGIDNKTIEHIREVVTGMLSMINKILQNPLHTFCVIHEIRIPPVRKFFKQKEKLDKIVSEIIASYRKSHDSKNNDLLTMLMEARDEESGTGMTDEQVRDEVMTVLLAGHETTTLALTWTWYLVSKHPEVENKFYDEVRSLLNNRLPQALDYEALSYTRNVFKESMRLYPPAWTFARATTEDIVIRDYHFPKGSVLWTLTYLLHRDERHFHHAEQFIPERWNEEGIKNLHKFAYLPFGAGNRMCIGEGFAWMEGVLVLATIASKFRLESEKDFYTDANPLFTLRTSQDVFMKVLEH